MKEPSPKYSIFYMAIIAILLILSSISIKQIIDLYINTGSTDFVKSMLGISAIVISFYLILQLRRKPVNLDLKHPEVFSSVKCSSCDYTTVRNFEEGDHVLKPTDLCPKCEKSTYISSIYRNIKDKEE